MNLKKHEMYEYLLKTFDEGHIDKAIQSLQEKHYFSPLKALWSFAYSQGFHYNFLQGDPVRINDIVKAQKKNFASKTALTHHIAKDEKDLSFRIDFKDKIVPEVPRLSGELKRVRFLKSQTELMELRNGSHAYNFNPKSKKRIGMSKGMDKLLDKHIVKVKDEQWFGYDEVYMTYYLPLESIDHFFGSVFPNSVIQTKYGQGLLSTDPIMKKHQKIFLRIKGVKHNPILLEFLPDKKAYTLIVSFATHATHFMKKIAIVHAFASKVIYECAAITRQKHRIIQIEANGSSKKVYPYTLAVFPFKFKDYYRSKFRNINTMFFSHPDEINTDFVRSKRVILIKKERYLYTHGDFYVFLIKHNREYMRYWTTILIEDCIENSRMVSVERLVNFSDPYCSEEILDSIYGLKYVYEQNQEERKYYKHLEDEKREKRNQRIGLGLSAGVGILAMVEAIRTILLLAGF